MARVGRLYRVRRPVVAGWVRRLYPLRLHSEVLRYWLSGSG